MCSFMVKPITLILFIINTKNICLPYLNERSIEETAESFLAPLFLLNICILELFLLLFKQSALLDVIFVLKVLFEKI